MGGKSKKVPISRFNMSAQYGVCHGPVDAVEAVLIGEKEAFAGDITSNTAISVNKEGLFGGIKKEGGVAGVIEVMMGGSDQQVSSTFASKLGGTPATLPGFRGLVSLLFRGSGSPAGFYWCATNPYIKSIWVRIRNIHRALGSQYAAVPRGSGTSPAPDCNPAHVIYSCLTNTDWGMGEDTTRIDTAAFVAAAQTLYNERLGISLSWTQSGTIEDFCNQILDCIKGVIFTSPRTGLITLRLIRDDYDEATLRHINPSNATLTNFARKAWGETVNEVRVTWTDPATEKEATVYSQDLGNIAMQGAVISDAKNYFCVRYAAKAQELADRELRSASAPLCSAEAIVNRSFWDVTPYEVVILDWPEYQIEGMVMRVTNVSYGTSDDPSIKLSLMEDVFSLPNVAFVAPPSSGWVDPAQPPIPATTAKILPIPAYAVLQDSGTLAEYLYPETGAALLVASPYSVSGSFSYDVQLEETTASGGTQWVQAMDTQQFAGRGELAGALVAEPSSVIGVPVNASGPPPWTDFFLIIGPDAAAPEDLELALVSSVDTVTGNLILMRGVLDTTPKDWPIGTRVWWVPVGLFDPLPATLTTGQTVRAKVITNTSLGQIDASAAPIFTGTAKARPTLPLRPANVKLNGVGFGLLELEDPGPVSVTWANRNRLLEDSAVYSWTGGTVAPEPGQTTTIRVLSTAGAQLGIVDDLSGESYSLDLSSYAGPQVDVQLLSKRSSETSWQGHKIRVKLPTFYFVGASDTTWVASTTTYNATIPAAVKTGDKLIASVMHRSALTPPAGWTLLTSVDGNDGAGTAQWLSIYERTATSGDPGASTTWTQAVADRMSVTLLAIRGVGSLAAPVTANGVSTGPQIPIQQTSISGKGLAFCFGAATFQATHPAFNETKFSSSAFTQVTPNNQGAAGVPRTIIGYKKVVASETLPGHMTVGNHSSTNGWASVTIIAYPAA